MDVDDLREYVREEIRMRWKRQPNGFMLSTKLMARKLARERNIPIVGWAGFSNRNSYWFIAQLLEELGGEYFDSRGRHGMRNVTRTIYSAASVWSFRSCR